MKKACVLLIFMLPVLFTAHAVYAFDQGMKMDSAKVMGMGMGEKMGMVDHVLKLSDYLSLSKEQMYKLEDIGIDSDINTIKDNAAIEVAELQLKKLMSDYNMNKEAIFKTIDEMYDLQKRKRKNMVGTHFEVMSVLTPEQFDKLKEFRLKMSRMSEAVRQKQPPSFPSMPAMPPAADMAPGTSEPAKSTDPEGGAEE